MKEDLILTSDPLPGSPEFEYLYVEVTRTQSSALYLKVPKGVRPSGRHRKILAQAARQTLWNADFETDYPWEDNLEVRDVRVIDEKEFNDYKNYTVEPKDIK